MGAGTALFSGEADGRQGTPKAETQADDERHLLDRTNRSGLARPAGEVRTVFDGINRFKELSESGLIEIIFHELSEDTDLQNISIDSSYIKAHKASAGAERGDSKIR